MKEVIIRYADIIGFSGLFTSACEGASLIRSGHSAYTLWLLPLAAFWCFYWCRVHSRYN